MGDRILVTGAAGKVGRRLVPRLLEKGYAVRALQRETSVAQSNDGVEIVEGDIRSAEDMDRAAWGVDAVCHLAGLLPFEDTGNEQAKNNHLMFDVNVLGTARLLEAARRSGSVRRFVHASSDAVYCTGWSKRTYPAPVDENYPHEPTLFYGAAKSMAEAVCEQYRRLYDMPIVVARLAFVRDPEEVLDLFNVDNYGAAESEDLEACRAKNALAAPVEGDGAILLDHLTDTRDTVEGLILALEKDAAIGQTFNILGPAPFSYVEEAAYLGEKTDRPAVRVRVPGVHSFEVSIAKARALLGYNPRHTARGMIDEALSRS